MLDPRVERALPRTLAENADIHSEMRVEEMYVAMAVDSPLLPDPRKDVRLPPDAHKPG